MPRKKSAPEVTWTVVDGENKQFLCLRCQGTHPYKLPMELKAFARQCQGFSLLHADCPAPAPSDASAPSE